MKVFLDTDILLDLLLGRDGYQDSAVIFQRQDEGRLQICVSILTMINVAYVYRKTVGQPMAVANVKYLSGLVEVLPMDSQQLQQALLLDGKDFEDTLQAVCAATAGCDYLITRNDRDYRIGRGLAARLPHPLPRILSPAAFLATL